MNIAIISPFSKSNVAAKYNLNKWVKTWKRKPGELTLINFMMPDSVQPLDAARGPMPVADDPGFCAIRKQVQEFKSSMDTIYVVGHGTANAAVVSDRSGPQRPGDWPDKEEWPSETKPLTAIDLGFYFLNVLQLRLDFPGRIKLLACQGAVGAGGLLVRFRREMVGKGYVKCCYGGYRENLIIGNERYFNEDYVRSVRSYFCVGQDNVSEGDPCCKAQGSNDTP